jgi:UDP-N-acetylmuramoylalanine-D-glutamate ligase
MLSAEFRLPALNILADHNQWHQKNLDYIRDKQPEHEGHRRVKLHRLRRQQIPAQPDHRPNKNDEKEPMVPTRSVIQSAKLSRRFTSREAALNNRAAEAAAF